MNKDIIKILNELLEIPQSTNGEINFYSIESNKFEAIITLVKKQLEDLESQLEEKDKVIKETIDYIKNITFSCEDEDIHLNELFDTSNLLEILERGKEVK